MGYPLPQLSSQWKTDAFRDTVLPFLSKDSELAFPFLWMFIYLEAKVSIYRWLCVVKVDLRKVRRKREEKLFSNINMFLWMCLLLPIDLYKNGIFQVVVHILIPALRRMRQKGQEFKATLSCIGRLCLKELREEEELSGWLVAVGIRSRPWVQSPVMHKRIKKSFPPSRSQSPEVKSPEAFLYIG